MPIAEEWLRFAPPPRALGPGEQWNSFLSYRSVRLPWLLNLYDVLQELGHKVFLDQMVQDRGGPPVAANALGASQAAALIWSPETDTAWVSRERGALERMAGERATFTYIMVQVGEGALSAFPQNRAFRGFATYPDGPAGGEILRFLHAAAGQQLSPEAEQFAHDQDLAAKQGTDEVRLAIKADNPDRLVQIFAQDGLPWKTSAVLGGRVAQGLIDFGRNQEAIGVLVALEQQFPKAVRPRQLNALALARRAEHSGETTDLEAAREILAGLYDTGQRDPETVGILRPHMDGHLSTNGRAGRLAAFARPLRGGVCGRTGRLLHGDQCCGEECLSRDDRGPAESGLIRKPGDRNCWHNTDAGRLLENGDGRGGTAHPGELDQCRAALRRGGVDVAEPGCIPPVHLDASPAVDGAAGS